MPVNALAEVPSANGTPATFSRRDPMTHITARSRGRRPVLKR